MERSHLYGVIKKEIIRTLRRLKSVSGSDYTRLAQGREGCCFPPVGFSVLRAALVRAARFSVSRFGTGIRRNKRLPVLRRFGGGGSAPLSRRSQPPPPAACGFSSSGGSVAYSFPEKSLLCKSFSGTLFYSVFRVVLVVFSRRVLGCDPRKTGGFVKLKAANQSGL